MYDRDEYDDDQLQKAIDVTSLPEAPTARYQVLDTNVFSLAAATISTLAPGIYRGTYMNYDWHLLKDKVVSDNIVITSDTSNKIIKQIKDFWSMEAAFKENGLLHKRGFMLVGKPGCGKSSIITTVMKEAISGGCIVFLPVPREQSKDLLACVKKIKAVEPNKKILVIMEDFEAYLGNGDSTSKWLNILDGADGFNNVIFLATSNYPEQIDTRFTTRPSRFDTVYTIDAPTYDDRLNYIKNRKMQIDEITARDIAKDTDGLSYAHIKELLISVYLFKLDYNNTMERMQHQGEHPISSEDFDGKKQKIGFDTSVGSKKDEKKDLELDEKWEELVQTGHTKLDNGIEIRVSPNSPDDIMREFRTLVEQEIKK